MSDQIIKLSPSGVIEILSAALESSTPVFVGGPKGIGKTDCGMEAARLTGHNVLLSHLSVEDPTAPGGMPWPQSIRLQGQGPDGTTTDAGSYGHVEMLPYGRLADALDCTEPTAWIWDDFPHAAPATQASYMQLLLAREINGHRIPDCVKIIAMGNLRKAGYGVHGMLEPVKGRFTLVEMVPNLNDFSNWCLDHDQQPEDIAFIRNAPDLLCPEAFDPEWKPLADFVNDPNPRNWIGAFSWAHRNLSNHVQTAAIAGRVGAGAAAIYQAYLTMYKNVLPNLDGILIDPKNAPIPDEKHLDVRYAIAVGLAYKATERNFDKIETYAQRWYKAGIGDMAVLMCRDSARRNPKVMTTAAWIKLASSELGKLFTGES